MPSEILENISLYCLISLAYFRLLLKLSQIRSSTTRGSGTSILSWWSLQKLLRLNLTVCKYQLHYGRLTPFAFWEVRGSFFWAVRGSFFLRIYIDSDKNFQLNLLLRNLINKVVQIKLLVRCQVLENNILMSQILFCLINLS